MAIQRGTTFQANVRLSDGTRLRPGGFKSMAEAELWEAQAKMADSQGLRPPPVASVRRPMNDKLDSGVLLGELRRRVLASPAPEGWHGSKAKDSAEEVSAAVVAFFGKDKLAASIDVTEVDRLIAALIQIGNSPGTINRKLAALSKMLRWAERRGIVQKLPHIPRQKEYEGRIRYLTDAEEARLLAALEVAGQHALRRLVVFLIDTGARISEALAMKWADVGKLASFWDTKGGKPRSVPLTTRAKAACAGATGAAGPFDGMNYWTLRAAFERARDVANLGDDVVIHTLRHTCASRFVMAGKDLRRVMQWMGHASIQTTMRYAHLAPEALDNMLPAEPDSRSPSAGERTGDTVSNVVSMRAA